MHCSCVRQSDLPTVSRLALDVLYHPDRVARFYRHPFRELASYQAAAVGDPVFRRTARALVAALRAQNPESPSLARLAEPGTVAVVTGQQVGLFGGPAYTVYISARRTGLPSLLTRLQRFQYIFTCKQIMLRKSRFGFAYLSPYELNLGFGIVCAIAHVYVFVWLEMLSVSREKPFYIAISQTSVALT